MKSLILVASDMATENDITSYKTRTTYPDAVRAAGGLPVLDVGGDARESAARFDGLLLTGGYDIDPALYGETPLNDRVIIQKARDEKEIALFEAFKEAKKPIFGICRGFQIINVMFSGDLWQDLPEQLGCEHWNIVHSVRTQRGNGIFDLFGASFNVNSTHHQAVRRLGEGLEAICTDETGTLVEALRHPVLPIAGVQWHPERMTLNCRISEGPDMMPLFERFIERCGKAAGDGGYL